MINFINLIVITQGKKTQFFYVPILFKLILASEFQILKHFVKFVNHNVLYSLYLVKNASTFKMYLCT